MISIKEILYQLFLNFYDMGKSLVTQTIFEKEMIQSNSLCFIRLYFTAKNWLQRQSKLTALPYNDIFIIGRVELGPFK